MATLSKQRHMCENLGGSTAQVVSEPKQSNNSTTSSYELQPLGTAIESPVTPSWRSLFVFTSRKDALPLTNAWVVTIIFGIINPGASIFYGKIFGVLASFGGGTLSANDTLHQTSIWCIALVVLGVVAWALDFWFLSAWVVFGELQAKHAREQLFTGMLDKDMEWYDLREDGIGSLLIRIQTQIRELQLAVSQPFGLLLFEFVGTFASLGIAFYFSWKLTLVLIATFPVAAIVLYLISMGLGPAIERQKRELSRASKYTNTAIANISTVKAFSAQDHEIWQYISTLQGVSKYYLRQACANAAQFGVTKFLLVAIFVQGFWYGIYLVNKGLSPANVVTTFYSAMAAFLAIETVLPQWLVIAKGMSAGETLKSILDQVHLGRKVKSMVGSVKPAACSGDIEINNVSFGYPSDPRRIVLKDSNFFFPSGEITFLVGTSGSGKSTVSNLIMKYYEPLSGKILVDGYAIQTLDTNWLRQNITLVQQDTVLFNDTIFKNIGFGRQDPTTREDVMKASETGCLQKMLQEMPDGIDTVVGSNGRSLSGGQNQRVAIARARLRDSSILILDESTSALDHRGRIEVMNKIREWRQGKTTIIITHDLSQIQDNDYVYVLENSKVVQEGYRQKLAGKRRGTFASILREEAEEEDNTEEARTVSRQPRRKFEPSKSFPTPEPNEDFPERWGNISRIFGVHHLPSDSQNMRSHRLSLGVAVARANDLRSQNIWSSPVILESPVIESRYGLSPRFFFPKAVFESPRPAPQRPSSINGRSPPLLQQEGQLTERQHPRPPASLAKIFGTIWPTTSWRERTILLFGFLCAVILGASTPAFAYVFARLLETFYTPENQVSEAQKWALILLGIAIVSGVAAFSAHYALEHAGQAWINALRVEALKRILAQPRPWFDIEEHSASRLNDCLDRNAEEMRNLVGRFAGLVLTVIFMLGISIVWSFIISWKLTLVALACGPAVYLVVRSFNFVSGKWENHCNIAADKTSSIFTEAFSNIRVVRALTLEDHFERKHRSAAMDAYKVGLKRALYSGLLFGLTNSLTFFIIALIFYYSNFLITREAYSVSSILQIVNLLLLGVANTTATLAMVPQINSSRTTATEMLYLTNLPLHEADEAQGTVRLSTPFPIQMNNLSFTYANQSPIKTLDRVSLKIDAGTCTAIVGPSGSGKSTIASILLGLYKPDQNLEHYGPPSLTFNGKSIRSCNMTSLRSFISVVAQKPLLFPSSILDNITYGLPEISPYRNVKCAEQAAIQARIHDFIISLDQGYATQVGDGGMGLSGGQAQRIAIARALVRRPQVLILDEATSALDGDNAEGVRETIKMLTRYGGAVVMISHDIEMMRVADRIVIVENGTIAETGGFEELMGKGGAFTRLLGGERMSVGLGLGLEPGRLSPIKRNMSPVKVRNRDTWHNDSMA